MFWFVVPAAAFLVPVVEKPTWCQWLPPWCQWWRNLPGASGGGAYLVPVVASMVPVVASMVPVVEVPTWCQWLPTWCQ